MFTLRIISTAIWLTFNFWNIDSLGTSPQQRELSIIEGVHYYLSQTLCQDAIENISSEEAEKFSTCHSYCAQVVFWFSYSELDKNVDAENGFCKSINLSKD